MEILQKLLDRKSVKPLANFRRVGYIMTVQKDLKHLVVINNKHLTGVPSNLGSVSVLEDINIYIVIGINRVKNM